MGLSRMAASLGLLALVTAPAKAGSYTVTTLQYPRGGMILPLGVNVENTVAGVLYESDNVPGGPSHGIIWSAGKYIKVDATGARPGSTEFTGINARGVAVGDYIAPDGTSHLFTYDLKTGAQTSTVYAPQPKLYFTSAAINNAGVVTGELFEGSGASSYTFLKFGTSIRIIGRPPKAKFYYGTAINNHNLVIGIYSLDGYDETGSFTFKNGVSTAFSLDGNTAAFLKFVGDDGTLAGYTGVPTTLANAVGFVQTGRVVTKYTYPGADGTTVAGVTSAGDVVGNYEINNSQGIFVFSQGKYININPVVGGQRFNATVVNPSGTFIGAYQASSGNKTFVAVCAADQIPCTQ